MKMALFWDVASYSLVSTDRRFRGAYCLHHQGDAGQDPGAHTSLPGLSLRGRDTVGNPLPPRGGNLHNDVITKLDRTRHLFLILG
jgi:hypothetical protein